MTEMLLRNVARGLVQAAVVARLRDEAGSVEARACPPGVSESFFRSLVGGHVHGPSNELEDALLLVWPDLVLGLTRRADLVVRLRFAARAHELLAAGCDPDLVRATALWELAAEEAGRPTTSRVWDGVLAGRATQ